MAYFDIYLDQSLPQLMIPYLRLIALGGTDSYLLEALFRNSVWGHLELPVSYQNEELICRVMRDACKSALSAYGTTIEEVSFRFFFLVNNFDVGTDNISGLHFRVMSSSNVFEWERKCNL